MDRKKVCALIRQFELGEEVKARFGDNYTRIPTKKLEEVLWDYDATLCDCPYSKEEQKPVQKPQEIDNPYEAACVAFVGILKDNGLLDNILAKL